MGPAAISRALTISIACPGRLNSFKAPQGEAEKAGCAANPSNSRNPGQ
jgi:hypothetical protein